MHLDISDEQVLDNAGIRLTAVRLLIWRKVRHELTDAVHCCFATCIALRRNAFRAG